MSIINIPPTPKLIIDNLYENGYEAFVVGGCVRDSLLRLTPNDWDICTSAKPEKVINVFKGKYNIVETGLKHGTVTLIDENKESYEITTYRVDGEYENNRRPVEVEFTSSLELDLSRRDFTINAMAYNDNVGLVDYFDGVSDIQDKIIRCVGNAYIRFNEDALRILRAYRFMAKLKGFKIDENVLISSKVLASLLENISVERIREEFNKILLEGPDTINLLYKQNILDYILPEAKSMKMCFQNNPYHIMDVWDHTITALLHSKKDLGIRLSVLLHDIGKPKCRSTDENGIDHFYMHNKASRDIANTALKRLKYDNKTINKVLALVEYHDSIFTSSKSIKKMLNKIGEDNFNDLLEVKYADICAKNPIYKDKKLNDLDSIKEKFKNILIENQCFSIKGLNISGSDLISLGMKPGKKIGETLEKLLDLVIDDESLNTKKKLINIVKETM